MPETSGSRPMPYPNGSAVPDVPGDLLALAQRVSDAFTSVEGQRGMFSYRWPNSAARTAQTGMRAGDEGYQVDTFTSYRYTGSTWEVLGGRYAAFRGSVLSIPNNAFTAVTFTSNQNRQAGAVSAQSGPDYTIAATGLYRISAFIAWNPNASGNRALRVRVGTTALAESLIQSFDTNGRAQSLVLPAVALTDGNLINMQAYQNSGGALDINQAQLLIETV